MLEGLNKMDTQPEKLNQIVAGLKESLTTATVYLAALQNVPYALQATEIASGISEIAKAVEGACGLVEQLTVLTVLPQTSPSNPIAPLVRDAVSLAANGSSHTVRCVIPEDLWPMPVTMGQLTRMIYELVTNSLHSMDTPSEVVLTLENISVVETDGVPIPKGSYIKLSVVDHGESITLEKQTQLQMQPSLPTSNDCSLGMSLCLAILRAYGGHLTINAMPGGGSNVTGYLPAVLHA